jgi:hypothetical protein
MTSCTRAGGSISSARQTPMREATAKYQPPKPSEFKERSNVTWKGCGHHDAKTTTGRVVLQAHSSVTLIEGNL